MRFRALCTDYDLTLVSGNHLDAATIASLKRLKASGRRLVLVTGRTLPWVLGPNGLSEEEARLFDRIVGENGAVMYDPATDKVTMLGNPPSPRLLQRLAAAGVDELTIGWASVHIPLRFAGRAMRIIHDLKLRLHVIAGTHHHVYVDSGIDKASGMRAALAELGLRPDQAVTMGDGHNDVAMLDRRRNGGALGIAMGNGVDRAKAVADLVTTGGPGTGVREVVDALVRHDLQRGLDGTGLTRDGRAIGGGEGRGLAA